MSLLEQEILGLLANSPLTEAEIRNTLNGRDAGLDLDLGDVTSVLHSMLDAGKICYDMSLRAWKVRESIT